MNPRLLAFILSWILTPKGFNHSTLTEEDLMLMYSLVYKLKVNWIYVIKDHMMKSKRLPDYRLPYAVLISRFLEHFEVDLDDEVTEMVKPNSEISHFTLRKLGLMKVNGKWQSNDQGDEEEDQGEEQEAGPSQPAANDTAEQPMFHEDYAMVPYEEPVQRGEPFSYFERMVLGRLDSLATTQRDHFELSAARFQHLDDQIEAIQDQLAHIHFNQEN